MSSGPTMSHPSTIMATYHEEVGKASKARVPAPSPSASGCLPRQQHRGTVVFDLVGGARGAEVGPPCPVRLRGTSEAKPRPPGKPRRALGLGASKFSGTDGRGQPDLLTPSEGPSW